MKVASIENSAVAKGEISIYRVYPDGSRELRQKVKNVVTNAGLQNALNNIAGSAVRWDYFAWGSSGVISGVLTPKSATTSGLVQQDGARAIDSYARISQTQTFTCVIPTTEGNTPGSISEFMLAPSGTTLSAFAAQAFQWELKTASYDLQFEYAITLANV